MAARYPLEYELSPRDIDAGTRWLTLRLRNVGQEMLRALDVRLNSLDAYSITVRGTGSYLPELVPDEEHMLPFQVSASTSTNLYVSVDGWRKDLPFHWESPSIRVTVGHEAAELVSLVALAEPYVAGRQSVKCEAVLRGVSQEKGLKLEFWANTPTGSFEELAAVETKVLSPGEIARYSAEVAVGEAGAYTVYAYLYDDSRRIGRKVEHIYVT